MANEAYYGIEASDWPDFKAMLQAFRRGEFRNSPAAATVPAPSAGSSLLILLDQLKPGESARAVPLRRVEGNWYDVALIGWIDEEAFEADPPTFAITLKDPTAQTPDVRSNPIPWNATAAEFAAILRQSPDPWPTHVVEVRLGKVQGVHLYRWKLCVKPHPNARFGEKLITSGLEAADNGERNIRAVCQRHPWIETGEVRTVSAALPMAEPGALRVGTTVVASVVGNGGLCVHAAEIRAIHDANEGVFPYYDY